MFKNWKTTLGGAVALAMFVCRMFGIEVPFHLDPTAVGLLSAGAVGVFAKDGNKE